jgi:hypothetical protein
MYNIIILLWSINFQSIFNDSIVIIFRIMSIDLLLDILLEKECHTKR